MSDDIVTLCLPKRTYAGAGAVTRAAEAARELGARSLFVFTDRTLVATGALDRLVATLTAESLTVTVFDDTEPEPTVAAVGRAAESLRCAADADLLVSLGGGSVIDTAKCANVLALNGGALTDYEDGAAAAREITRLLPHVVIPTTAGTGSEATVWAVFVDPQRRLKNGICDPRLIADVAILDPALTTTLPPRVTAGTGMDALTHAIEASVSRYASPLTDALAAQAVALIGRSLPRAVVAGDDVEARADMLLGSFLAGAAFSNSSCGLVHTLSEALGGFFRTPHGVTNGLLLAPVMEFNRSAAPERFAQLAAGLGVDVTGLTTDEAGRGAVVAVRQLVADIGLSESLRDLGVGRDDLAALADAAAEWAGDSGNPRDADRAQLLALYEEAF